MVKYKVAFTISGETLFSLLAKTLPLDDLAVQEIVDEAKFHQLSEQRAKLNEYLKPVIKHHRPHKRYATRKPVIPFSPNTGINKILLSCLATGPHRAYDMRPLLKEGGYSPNSVGSRLQKLAVRGIVIQHGDGLWSLAERETTNPGVV